MSHCPLGKHRALSGQTSVLVGFVVRIISGASQVMGVFGMWCVLRHVHVSLSLEAFNLERQTLQLHMKMASTREIQEKRLGQLLLIDGGIKRNQERKGIA